MKVTFLLPGNELSGGVRVIYEHANELTRRGHQVTIIYPCFTSWTIWRRWRWLHHLFGILLYARNLIRQRSVNSRRKPDWFDLRAEIQMVPDFSPRYIPESDAIVATAFITAEYVASYRPSKGKKFYFIQSYETWATNNPADVDYSWKLPLHRIVIAGWLNKLATEKFGVPVDSLIVNGINTSFFNNPAKTFNTPPRLLMLYHQNPVKGIPDGFAAYRIIKQIHPDIKLKLFGVYPRGVDIPVEVEYVINPSQTELRELYRTSDIFISPSHLEGCQLPPMEAMACRCAVVATNVGGIPDYAIADQTALVVPPGQPDQLADAALSLINNPIRLRQISEAGYQHIQQFSWSEAGAKLEKILKSVIGA